MQITQWKNITRILCFQGRRGNFIITLLYCLVHFSKSLPSKTDAAKMRNGYLLPQAAWPCTRTGPFTVCIAAISENDPFTVRHSLHN